MWKGDIQEKAREKIVAAPTRRPLLVTDLKSRCWKATDIRARSISIIDVEIGVVVRGRWCRQLECAALGIWRLSSPIPIPIIQIQVQIQVQIQIQIQIQGLGASLHSWGWDEMLRA